MMMREFSPVAVRDVEAVGPERHLEREHWGNLHIC